ncbi:MAG: rod shape-determining protein MreC [Inquilinus sp.]|nr:rod shape-determining protein MreC [Inquilinus sp.]
MVRIAALRALAHRFSFLALVMAAVALMVLGRVDPASVDGLRTGITDTFTPIMSAFTRPASSIGEVADGLHDLARLQAENAALRAENDALLQYRQAAFRLEAENLSLRTLMNYRPSVPHAFLSARIIADNSGAFVRSLAVDLGAANGVRDGQAAMGPNGLIGRVVQAGDRSARILLITDLNAKVPVVLEGTRERAMLGGDNTDRPRLLYLPPDAEVPIGTRVVTSGHGGMFPPGLAVGTVAAIEDGIVRVAPIEDLQRLEFVRITDFRPGEAGGQMQLHPGYNW